MSFRLSGFTYDEFLRPWMRNKSRRRECLKWPTGYRNFWERISPEEYDNALKKKQGGKYEHNH